LFVAGAPSNAIAYLDGVRLRRALSAGIRRVLTQQEELNRINVFPVADADTGTNLAATLRAVLEATGGQANPHAGTLLGNHGHLNAQRFREAVSEGARCAREALSEPREGTILSVITAFSDEIGRRIHGGVSDFRTLVQEGLERARQALADTQHQLPQLERAGVVDAGAMGFVEFLEGILAFVRDGNLREVPADPLPVVSSGGDACEGEPESPSYRFCTECVVRMRRPISSENAVMTLRIVPSRGSESASRAQRAPSETASLKRWAFRWPW